MGRLSGKVALVTGAGRGLGKAIAIAFAKEGATLFLTSRTIVEVEAVAKECRSISGSDAIAWQADVTQEAEVTAMFSALDSKLGRIDLLVNNAGTFEGARLEELSLSDWNKVITTNLTAPFLCTRSALQRMKPKRNGRIINIGSIAGQRVRPQSAPYATSKHGLWGLTQVTALEGREYGVTCGVVNPGNILVERRATSGKIEDQEPMMASSDVAEVVLCMAVLPPHVEMLEAIVLPAKQDYVGRG